MSNFVAEFIGTALLIVLGNGVVANVVLNRTKGHGSGWIVIATGWGMAVALAVYAVGRVSGAHINPAVTFALACIGSFPWSEVPGYIAAQMGGAIAGASLVWVIYYPHWSVTDSEESKLAAFATAPAIRNPLWNLISEGLATAVLVFGILAIGDNAQMLSGPEQLDLSSVFSSGIQPLLVGLLVLAIGLSLGGPTGYAINPARDLGPRIAHALLPIAGKGDSDWAYSWVPVVGPLAGGAGGALLYTAIAF